MCMAVFEYTYFLNKIHCQIDIFSYAGPSEILGFGRKQFILWGVRVVALSIYFKFENFRETLLRRSFVKIKPSQNAKITLSFTDVDKSCPSHEFLTWQICLLTFFAEIKFSRKFPILQ